MKLKLIACVAAGALAAANLALAAPEFESFLKVDINGYQWADGAGAPGPTQAGYSPWNVVADDFFAESGHDDFSASTNAVGISESFATSEGNITVTMTGRTTQARNARNRGAGAGGGPGTIESLRQDFVFAARDGALAGGTFGQNWIELKISGLVPGQDYEFTGLAQDVFNGQGDITLDNSSFQAWTDRANLSGLNGPGEWLNAKFGPNATYGPSIGGVGNPIPTHARAPISGDDPVALGVSDYHYSASFRTFADAGGVVTVYTWADPNGFSGTQTATLLSGFELGISPEPTSLVILMVGLAGIAGLRRRVG